MSTESDLATLVARAQKAYSLKDYSNSVTLFADACELQAKLHGSDNDPRNAHILYLYGKALYQVAISKSDILGGGATAASSKKDTSDTVGSSKKQQAAESTVGNAALKKETALASKGKVISFQGDENWDNSGDEEGVWDDEEDIDEDGDNAEGSAAGTGVQEGEEEEEDDMATAWEVLELARVLFHKSIDPTWTPQSPISSAIPSTPPAPESDTQQTTAAASSHPLTQAQLISLQTQLADIYDLLGEISLESENFPQAIIDLRSSLTLKLHLFPPHDKLVSEAHYKLSLALEFASAMEGISDEESTKGREDAAEQMEHAVNSVKGRIEIEEGILDSKIGKGKGKGKESNQDDKDITAAEKSLEEAKEIVAELEQRLNDLRAPQPQDELDSANPIISGLLKSVLGESPAEQKKRVEDAVKSANDVSGLVRKKAKKTDNSTTSATGSTTTASLPLGGAATTGKRKLEDVEMQDIQGKVVGVPSREGAGSNGNTVGTDISGSGVLTPPGSKKAKVEDSLDVEEREGGSAASL